MTTTTNQTELKLDMPKITKTMCATGSYGLSHGTPGGVQTVWFCNRGYTERNGVAQDPCVHETRADARRCRTLVYPRLTTVARRGGHSSRPRSPSAL